MTLDAHIEAPAQEEARAKRDAAAMARYRETQRNLSDEARAERAFEMRAAFGPGVEVVNIFTGERHTT